MPDLFIAPRAAHRVHLWEERVPNDSALRAALRPQHEATLLPAGQRSTAQPRLHLERSDADL